MSSHAPIAYAIATLQTLRCFSSAKKLRSFTERTPKKMRRSRFCKSNLPHQRSEARIGLKVFRFRAFAKPRQQVRAFLVSFLQPLKRLVLVSESSVNVNTADARDAMFLFSFVQSLTWLQRSPTLTVCFVVSSHSRQILRIE